MEPYKLIGFLYCLVLVRKTIKAFRTTIALLIFSITPFLNFIALTNRAFMMFFSLNKKKTLKPLSMSFAKTLYCINDYQILPTDFDHIVFFIGK